MFLALQECASALCTRILLFFCGLLGAVVVFVLQKCSKLKTCLCALQFSWGGGGQVFFGTISNLMGLDVVCRATLEKGQIIHPTSNL